MRQKIKHIAIVIILVGTWGVIVPVQASVLIQSNPVALQSGLIGWWTFDGKTVNWATGTAADSSGQNNTGSFSNMATTTSPIAGKIGQALNFGGKNNYLTVASTTALQLTSGGFSVSAWVYATSTNTQMFLFHGKGCSSFASWWLSIGGNENQTNPNKFGFGFNTSNGGATAKTVASVANATTNAWVHVVGTYDGTATLKLYVNGVLNNTASVSGNPWASNENLYIGEDPGCSGRFLTSGYIDDARVYNRTLTAQEAAQLYKNGSGTVGQSSTVALTTGLVGYWPLDGKTINWTTGQVADLSGTGNNGSLVSLATTTAPTAGMVGQALNLNGVGNVSIPDAPTLNPGTGSFTISAWIRENSLTSGMVVAAKSNGGTASASYGWHLAAFGTRAQTIQLHFATAGTSLTTISGGLMSPSDIGTWRHVVVVVDRSNISASKVYINGAAVVTTVTDDGTNTGSITNTLSMVIGNESDGGFPWKGRVDDLRMYNRALTAQEAAALYRAGDVTVGQSNASAVGSGLVGYWTFDGKRIDWTTGSTTDSSGQGNNGMLMSMSTTTSPTQGKIGQALLFDAVDDKVKIPDASSLNPSTVTISAWIYSTGADPSATSERIVDKANTGTINQNGYRMQAFSAVSCSSASAEWGMQWYNGSAQLLCGPVIANTTNKWTHLVFTHDGTTGRLYTNGVLTASKVASYTGTNTFNLAIGNSDQTNKPFTGKIDDVRIYNRALSAQEVQHLYLTGK